MGFLCFWAIMTFLSLIFCISEWCKDYDKTEDIDWNN